MERGFGTILSALRREHGISQRALAADLHVSQALLSHYENGAREPGLPLVCRICDYFGVSADYLLGRIDLSPEAPLPSLERLQAAMAAEDDPDVKQAAQACISSAAERLRLRMSGEGSEIAAAEHASDMAAAELELMRAVSRRGKKE
ncbi:MAG: helix-turn-helix domain-containing protein [Oscillospiraceae bacterium]